MLNEKQEETDAAAQRRTIQNESETSSNLADESPQAQEIQEAKKKQSLR